MSAASGEGTAALPDEHRAERACLVALAGIEGIGPSTLLGCLFGVGAVAAWDALRRGEGCTIEPLVAAARRLKGGGALARFRAAAQALDPEAVLRRHEAAGQQVMVFGRAGYPARLLGDPAPPPVLFAQGSLAALDGPSVAIVGTRNATRLGRDTAAALARELGSCGISIVSGLALGIDGAAHAALIDQPGAGGPERGVPIGVVAAGLDRSYPRRHQLLHRQVAAGGVLLSETPLGGRPLPWRFPARNRIIAGCADAVVVVESRSTGGSMLTASEALARDVPVLAVPGHPTAAASAGTLDLICDGAIPVREVADVLVAIGRGGQVPAELPSSPSSIVPLRADALLVHEELAANPRTLAELVLATSLDLGEVSAALLELEGRELVVRDGPWFEQAATSDLSRGKGSRR